MATLWTGDHRHNNGTRLNRYRRYTPQSDPQSYGWTKPVVGRAEYRLDCGSVIYVMKIAQLPNRKTGYFERVRVVYMCLAATGDQVADPIVYDMGCDLDTVTDLLIDHADDFRQVVDLLRVDHYSRLIDADRANEASSPPPSLTCPIDAEIPW